MNNTLKNPQNIRLVFWLAGACFAIPTLLTLFTTGIHQWPELISLFSALAFAYLGWAIGAGVKKDEFTKSVDLQGFRFGVISVMALGFVSTVFFAPQTPAKYVAIGITLGGFLTFSIGLVPSRWNLRK